MTEEILGKLHETEDTELRRKLDLQVRNSFRDYNKPKKRSKAKASKRKLPLKTTKGFG